MEEARNVNLLIVGEQNQFETYLGEDNIVLLKRMFKDKDSYAYYMRSLWILRNLTKKICEINAKGGLTYNKKHEMFPVLKLTNDLMGALYRENTYVIGEEDKVNCIIDGEIHNVHSLD